MKKLIVFDLDGTLAESKASLDEEMANLVTYQRSYEASSRVFNIIDGLLDTVVNHLGA